jgi:hypothetical protein
MALLFGRKLRKLREFLRALLLWSQLMFGAVAKRFPDINRWVLSQQSSV